MIFWPVHCYPSIVVAGRFPMKAYNEKRIYLSKKTHALHLHEYDGVLWIGKRRFILRSGDITITPVGVKSNYSLKAPGHHLCIHFNPALSRGAKIQVPLHLRMGPGTSYVSERFRHIASLHHREEPDAQIKMAVRAAASSALQELLLCLSFQANREKSFSARKKANASIARLLGILEKKFTQTLTVPELAREVGLSQNLLAREFKKKAGMTIPQFILQRRIDYASHLLSITDASIKSVGIECGIPDPQYFNKVFRRMTGDAPSRSRGVK
jgi:AraC-like DNA-binding protein